MTTKKLYEILDKASPSNIVYNLRKVRSVPVWRVRVWCEKTFDKLGILAPYVEDELHPQNYVVADVIADFIQVCNLALIPDDINPEYEAMKADLTPVDEGE